MRPTKKMFDAILSNCETLVQERDEALDAKKKIDEANVKLIERVKSLEGQLAQAKENQQIMGNELDTALGEVRGLKDALTIVTRKK